MISKAYRHKLLNICLALCLVVGLYFPTSYNEQIIGNVFYINSMPILLIGLILVLQRNFNKLKIFISFSIVITILLCTFISPFPNYTLGAFAPYLIISFLFLTDISDLQKSGFVDKIFIGCNIINIVLCFLIILNQSSVVQFIMNNYSQAFPGLLKKMILWYNKPVLSFGSHSLSAFYFFSFFFMNYLTYLSKKKKTFFILALAYLPIIFMLTSTTALFFLIIAFSYLAYYSIVKFNIMSLGILISMAGIIIYFILQLNIDFSGHNFQRYIFTSSEFGLNTRYSGDSALNSTYDYIKGNPFRPIGISYSDQLYYTDSGPVVFILRGSFPLLILVYSGFFLFVNKNINDSKLKWQLIFLFMIFELGYPNLLYFRTPMLLLFIVFYLNNLKKPDKKLSHG